MQQPAWLERAWRELGESERAGAAHNARILALYRDAGHGEINADEVAWCAAFAGACLERAKVACTRSLMARSYLAWGEPITDGRLGAVAVFSRGSDTSQGHVGFWIGETEDSIMLLGGNQGDAVSVMPVAKARLLGFRWPSESVANLPAPGVPSANDADAFLRALKHVLEMEGGYTEDPHDPGGPTNFGIILNEFAAWKGERLDAANTERLKGELKRIDAQTVRDIYFANYWQAAGCAELPSALAFMHFDAAVNHGTGTAIRFLQQAVGAGVDGEIGPETRAAVQRASLADALSTYAELRRTRYRSLKHFWRFGRGWLRRVDVTLTRARKLIDADQNSQSQQQGDADMTETSNETTTKWWGHSITIWGTIVSALAVVVPAVGPAVGVDISGDLVQNAGDDVVSAIQAVAALVGTLMTIYGRVRATQPITRRTLSLKI